MFASPVSSNQRFAIPTPVTSLAASGEPISLPETAPAAAGERRLLQLYISGIRQAVEKKSSAGMLHDIPQETAFGGWWQALYNASHSPMFLAWAKALNIDTTQPITVDGETLTVVINGESTRLQLKDQAPQWQAALAPVMAAMKAFYPSAVDLPTSPTSAPLIIVARFHGEVLLPHYSAQTLERATQLEHNQAFDTLKPGETYVRLEYQSPQLLQQQKNDLGDSINQFNLLKHLQHYRGEDVNYLLNGFMPIHPDSTYGQSSDQPEATLADVLAAGGWQVPQNPQQMYNLIRALAAPALPAPPYGNYGGALAWPQPLSIEDQAELFRIIAENKPPLPGLDPDSALGTTDVLGALVKNVPRSVLNTGDPHAVMQWILNSSVGRQLGAQLKARLGEVAANMSPEEVLLTALGVTLDAASLSDPKEPAEQYVAGFDLAAPQFYRQPVSVIKQQLIKHLVDTNKTTPEAAPIAAMLLLSRKAPELQVKGVPPYVTFNSFASLSLKSAVARIEATSPGASAQMTFTEVVEFDAIDPVREEDQLIQDQTQLPAIIQWGRGHGLLGPQGPYTEQQISATRQAISDQQNELVEAIEVLATPAPTQRSVALARLKQEFGEGIDYEEKTIRSSSVASGAHTLSPALSVEPKGSYSLLDFYLAKKNRSYGWVSTNPRIDADVFKRLRELPDPGQEHKAAFDEYRARLSKAWSTVTRTMIANLAPQDRKNIESGTLTIYRPGVSRRIVERERTKEWKYYPPEPLEERGKLIIKTEHEGKATYYQFDPRHNRLQRHDDWQETFKEGLQEPYTVVGEAFDEKTEDAREITRVVPESDEEARQQQARPDSKSTSNAFSSSRSQYLGKKLADEIIEGYHLDDVRESTLAVTTFDEEKAQAHADFQRIIGFFPGVSMIRNLVNGDYVAAAGDIIFDVVMTATTAGIGRAGGGALKGVAKDTVQAAAKSSITPVRKMFGQSLLMGFADGAKTGAKAGSKLLTDAVRRVRTGFSGKTTQSGVRLTPQQANVVSQRSDLFEGTAKAAGAGGYYPTIAKFDSGSGRWFAYNPATNKSFGRPLADFKPTTTTHLDTQWQNVTRKAENGAHAAAFREGYLNGNPADVPGYSAGMKSAQIKKLAVSQKHTPKNLGILARQQERVAVQFSLKGVDVFNNAVRSAGGRVTPISQLFYLSQVQPLSQGQCAALSHVMIEAIKRGKGQQFIDNLFKAAANPNSAASKRFIQTVTGMQSRFAQPTAFHGISNVPSKPFNVIADELVTAPQTKYILVSDKGHAMVVGVKVEGGQRTYFFFEPNYGLAEFPTLGSLRKAMNDVFTNKKFPRPYANTDPTSKVLHLNVSEYRSDALSKVGVDSDTVASLFMTPL